MLTPNLPPQQSTICRNALSVLTRLVLMLYAGTLVDRLQQIVNVRTVAIHAAQRF